ncbi:hypothetical protein HY947_05705 [Candidatus Gottesmanbacteria bacterium]|nr:hypothetical protein [Candidatus Gottesmanbacteria bacterium]
MSESALGEKSSYQSNQEKFLAKLRGLRNDGGVFSHALKVSDDIKLGKIDPDTLKPEDVRLAGVADFLASFDDFMAAGERTKREAGREWKSLEFPVQQFKAETETLVKAGMKNATAILAEPMYQLATRVGFIPGVGAEHLHGDFNIWKQANWDVGSLLPAAAEGQIPVSTPLPSTP